MGLFYKQSNTHEPICTNEIQQIVLAEIHVLSLPATSETKIRRFEQQFQRSR